jgi:archaellum component FlaC
VLTKYEELCIVGIQHGRTTGEVFAVANEEKILGFLIKMDARLDGIDVRLNRMDARLDGIDARLDRMDARLDGIDVRLDRMDARLDGIDARLDRMDARFDGIDARLDRMEGDIQELKAGLEEVKDVAQVNRDNILKLWRHVVTDHSKILSIDAKLKEM